MIRIVSDDGDTIETSSNGTHVVVEIDCRGEGVSIWLSPLQVDALVRALAAARVEISNARPLS